MYRSRVAPIVSKTYARSNDPLYTSTRPLEWLFKEAPIEIALRILEECFPVFDEQVCYPDGKLYGIKSKMRTAFATLAASPHFLEITQPSNINQGPLPESLLRSWTSYSTGGFFLAADTEGIVETSMTLLTTTSDVNFSMFEDIPVCLGMDSFGSYIRDFCYYQSRSSSEIQVHIKLVIEVLNLGHLLVKVIREQPSISTLVTQSTIMPAATYSDEDQFLLLEHRILRAVAHLQLYIAMKNWSYGFSRREIIYWLFVRPHGCEPLEESGIHYADTKIVLHWMQYLHKLFSKLQVNENTGGVFQAIFRTEVMKSLFKTTLGNEGHDLKSSGSQWSEELHYELPFANSLTRSSMSVADGLCDDIAIYLEDAAGYSCFTKPYRADLAYRESHDFLIEECEASRRRDRRSCLSKYPDEYCLHEIWPLIDKTTGKYKGQHRLISPVNLPEEWESYGAQQWSSSTQSLWTLGHYPRWRAITPTVIQPYTLLRDPHIFPRCFRCFDRRWESRYHQCSCIPGLWLILQPERPHNLSQVLHQMIDAEIRSSRLCQTTLEVIWGMEKPREGCTGAYGPGIEVGRGA
ncbi:hypothetical protein BT63DRAFT_468645 [Microthyrium microscopicum]|uniref:Uncharacterized protein n=1 Tax=Microthyrium microscopicum TaxID=703497 RepID=A0A6A6UHD5_9PEZI|nr:hypothetical protein BT63DRAFT_468645 [Microthyrium microscopicum]